MLKAHKIKLRPNEAQVKHFIQATTIRRRAYNWMLGLCERYQSMYGKYPSVNEVAKKFRKRKADWMTEYGCYTYEVTDEVKQSIKKVIANRSIGMESSPHFASKYNDAQSFYVHNRQISFDDDTVHLSMLPTDKRVKMAERLRFSGKIMGARVSRRAEKWYLSVQIDTPESLPEVNPSDNIVGIDIGSGVLATLTTGKQYPVHKALESHLEELARLQQIMANKDKLGQRKSNRRLRVKKKITRLHAHIADIRANALHGCTTDIVRNVDAVSVEGFDIAKLVSKPRSEDETARLKTTRNRKMLDAGTGELRRQLEYKTSWVGKPFVKGDKKAATSSTCSVCGEVSQVPINRETWKCRHCKTKHDRRLNAAINVVDMTS